VFVKAAWLALGLATLALVAWIALRPGHLPGDDDAAAIRAALARIERAQAQQETRLARLERRIAPVGPAVGRAAGAGLAAAGSRAGNGTRTNGPTPDPAQAEAQQQAQLRALDDRLVAEPLAAGWASAQERAVGTFLAPANLAREGLAAPRSRETRCQSRLCRIRLTYADESTALAAQLPLLQAIAPGLPHARTFLLPNPDGGVDLLIFAGGDEQAVR
jgi:hypothetical protein